MKKVKTSQPFITSKVFLDDVRFPPDDTWTEFEDPYDCWDYIRENINMISEISFDHDLAYWNLFGEEVTWYDVLQWLLEYCEDSWEKTIPIIHFHTANSVGKKRMEDLLLSYKTHAGLNSEARGG